MWVGLLLYVLDPYVDMGMDWLLYESTVDGKGYTHDDCKAILGRGWDLQTGRPDVFNG